MTADYCQLMRSALQPSESLTVCLMFNRKPEGPAVASSETPATSDGRVLRSVVRVGPLAKGLILHDDLNVQLVVLCVEKPTRTLLDTVADRLTKQLQVVHMHSSTHAL